MSLRGLFSVIASPFFSCHCEEQSDEAISLFPRGPLRLLRSARKDKRGRGPPQIASLRSQRRNWGVASLRSQRQKGGVIARAFFLSLRGLFLSVLREALFPLSLRGAKRRSNLASSPPARPQGPLSLLRSARKDRRGKTPSDCFAPLTTTELRGCFAPLTTTERGRHCEERSDEAISFHYPPHLQISSYKSSHLGFMLSINRTLLSLLPPLICFSLLMASEISLNTS